MWQRRLALTVRGALVSRRRWVSPNLWLPRPPPPRGKLVGPLSSLRVSRLRSGRFSWGRWRTRWPQMTVRETSLPSALSGRARRTRRASRAPPVPRGGAQFRPEARGPVPTPTAAPARARRPTSAPGARPAAQLGRRAAAASQCPGAASPRAGIRPRASLPPLAVRPGPGLSSPESPSLRPPRRKTGRRGLLFRVGPDRRAFRGFGRPTRGTTFPLAEGLFRGGVGSGGAHGMAAAAARLS